MKITRVGWVMIFLGALIGIFAGSVAIHDMKKGIIILLLWLCFLFVYASLSTSKRK